MEVKTETWLAVDSEKKSMKWVAKKSIFIFVLMMYTNLLLMPAYFLGINGLSDIYYLSFLVLLGCIALMPKTMGKILRNKLIFFWVGVVCIIPCILSLMHFTSGYIDSVRLALGVGKILFYLLLFLVCVCGVYKGWIERSKIYPAALVIIFAQISLDLFATSVLSNVANSFLSADVLVRQTDELRAVGLFFNPNLTAAACVLALIGYLTSANHASLYKRSLMIAATLLAIILTGSRTSIIICLVSIVLIYSNGDFIRKLSTKKIAIFMISLLAALIFFASVALVAMSALEGKYNVDAAVERIADLPQVVTSIDQTDDGSVRARADQLSVYTDEVIHAPLLGRNPSYLQELVASGVVLNASQNSWIDGALSFGIAYTIAIGLFFYFLYRQSVKSGFRRSLPTKHWRVLLIATLLYTLSLDNILWLDYFVIALGLGMGDMLKAFHASAGGSVTLRSV